MPLMYLSSRICFGALFRVICFSFAASSQSSDTFFFPTDDPGIGNSQYVSLDASEGGPELLSYEDSASFFSLNGDFDTSIPMNQDLSSTLFTDNDPASVAILSEDALSFSAFDDGPALAFNDILVPSLSEVPETLFSEEMFEASEFDSETLVDIDCESDEEQTFGKSRRAEGLCPMPAGKKTWPPPYASPERYNDLPENDPKPRPRNQTKNNRFDFVQCPSGPGGYRMYAVCDMGVDTDRVYDPVREWTVYNVDHDCMLHPLPRSLAQTADSRM